MTVIQRWSRAALAPLAALTLAVACGGSDSTEPTQTTNQLTNGSFSATINGTAWSAAGRAAVSKSGTIVAIAAVSPTYTISFALSPLTAPATFNLAYLNSSASLAIVSQASGQGWTTFAQGGTGTVVVTTYTASRIAGTFSFDAAATSGGATGIMHVTNGAFDITY